jgi:hypothetical protein
MATCGVGGVIMIIGRMRWVYGTISGGLGRVF